MPGVKIMRMCGKAVYVLINNNVELANHILEKIRRILLSLFHV